LVLSIGKSSIRSIEGAGLAYEKPPARLAKPRPRIGLRDYQFLTVLPDRH
jgi:hypothetical protein